VLVLALETSSRRGSVALLESGRLLAEAWHDEPNAHGERLLGLVDEVFFRAERRRIQLDRVAVGRGPGAFTGLRVGLAMAQGIASGLGLPAVGIGSLRAMAAAMPGSVRGNRWPILDARRGELFVACYDEGGAELLSPRAMPRHEIGQELRLLRETLNQPSPKDWLLGHAVSEVSELVAELPEYAIHLSPETDWPGAAAVGQLASNPAELGAASPEYLRDADAVLPKLPPCPLNQPRETGP
jgi:tRNA threonylcarbamoyladenosine biosynthesis protein TsaB